MGLENLKQELDFLTGRYAMKKRPTHGRLFSTPSRLSYGPDLLDDVSIEGRKMRVPTPPRPYPSPSSAGYVRRGYGGSGEGSPICAELGESSHRRSKEDSRRLQRKSYSSPLYDPDSLRKSRTVRFEAPHTANSSPQPIVLPEQIEVPQADWEDEMPLEGESFEVAQASEELQEQVELAVAREPLPPADEVLQSLIVSEPLPWAQQREEEEGPRVPAEPEPEVVEEIPEEEPPQESSQDAVDSKPVATSSPRPPPKSPSPLPAVKPKPKKERPVPERIPKPSRPRPVEKPPAPAAPKPVKQPKPPPPKPVRQPKPPKPKPEPKEKKKEPVDKPVHLPISPPEKMGTPEPVEEPPLQPLQPVVHSRAPVKKKEKLPPPPPRRRTPSPPPQPPIPVVERRDRDDWLNDSDDEQKDEQSKAADDGVVTADIPTLPLSLPDRQQACSPRPGAGRGARSAMATPLMALKSRPRWGQKQRDTSFVDAEARDRLAEARRRRFAVMMDKSKHKKGGDKDQGDHGGYDFDEDGFLGKYCIFNYDTRDKYRHTFNIVDEDSKGYLTEEETAVGLGAINPNLRDSDMVYLFRVLEVLGHKMKDGTDLNVFCILAALSQRVSKLDDWAHCEWARKMMAEMGKVMADMDYRNLERKMFLCKTLWECNVDEDTNTISRDQLLVELRAGGVSPHEETEVLHKMPRSLDVLLPLPHPPPETPLPPPPPASSDGTPDEAKAPKGRAKAPRSGDEPEAPPPHEESDMLQSLPRSLDFFDFLLYVPLFITIHESVVRDPLSVSRPV